MISISIAPEFAAAGVPARLGVIACSVRVAPAAPALIAAIEEVEAARSAEFAAGLRPADVPAVAATRQAYKAFGKDPSRYRPSAEALLRRLALGKGLYRINNVVDVINLVSLRTGISIGGYDADLVRPPVSFRPAGESETYETIGRGPMNLAGLPVFSDALGPFGSATSDSARTSLSPGAEHLLMVLVGFGDPAGLPAAVEQACADLAAHCAARDIESAVV